MSKTRKRKKGEQQEQKTPEEIRKELEAMARAEEERRKEIRDICDDLFGPFEKIKESYLSMKFGQIDPKYHPHPRTIAKIRHMNEWPTNIATRNIFFAYCYQCTQKTEIHVECKLSMKAITGSCQTMSDEVSKEQTRRFLNKRKKEAERR